eukprot:CAMPEP_0184301476 /NCGR_PEP_ID=MMETSP1049-20130417/11664_1 /TAXON_ID=77928 /ORGANISM="Proteomonas sulcata, Strain CCMP704" /LENGTH=123 /DNA_ID=CAMNT_0026612487 /DNA_START=387 /DNA_END=758 /DNA_ORIENTATION=+
MAQVESTAFQPRRPSTPQPPREAGSCMPSAPHPTLGPTGPQPLGLVALHPNRAQPLFHPAPHRLIASCLDLDLDRLTPLSSGWHLELLGSMPWHWHLKFLTRPSTRREPHLKVHWLPLTLLLL